MVEACRVVAERLSRWRGRKMEKVGVGEGVEEKL